MRKILLILALPALSAGATEVHFKSQDWNNSPQTRPLKLTPQNQYLTDGTNIFYGVAVTVPWTNGSAVVQLSPNNYTTSASAINGSFTLSVPNTNATLNAIDLTTNLMTFTNYAPSGGLSSNQVYAIVSLNAFPATNSLSGETTLFTDVTTGDRITLYNGEVDALVGLHYSGDIFAGQFVGSGLRLDNLSASSLSIGAVPLARLPGLTTNIVAGARTLLFTNGVLMRVQ